MNAAGGGRLPPALVGGLVAWFAAAAGWVGLFLWVVLFGIAFLPDPEAISQALFGSQLHHLVPVALGLAWGPLLVAVASPRSRSARVVLSVAGALVFGVVTLVVAEVYSPLALVALVPVRAVELAVARRLRGHLGGLVAGCPVSSDVRP